MVDLDKSLPLDTLLGNEIVFLIVVCRPARQAGVQCQTTSATSRNDAFKKYEVSFNNVVRRQYVAVNRISILKQPHNTLSQPKASSGGLYAVFDSS